MPKLNGKKPGAEPKQNRYRGQFRLMSKVGIGATLHLDPTATLLQIGGRAYCFPPPAWPEYSS